MDELIASIYLSPEDWKLDCNTFSRGRDHIWISNGWFFVAPYCSPALPFNMVTKWKFWKAYKWWCKNRPLPEIAALVKGDKT